MAQADGSVILDTGINKAGLINGLSSLGGIVSKGIVGALAALGALTVAIVNVGTEYEKTISGIKAISGATDEEMATLSATALLAGKETVFSAAEAAEGLQELIKAGLSTEQANVSLKDALDLAAAGEIGVADAAEIASTVLNAFRDDQLSVKDAADLLAGGANASATDITGLKYGLSQCSAVAAGMGLSFKDTSTTLALFAQYGLKGSDAGTSLKTMLMRLQPITKRQKDVFSELNLVTEDGKSKFYDAAGSMRPMEEIAGILQNSMKDLTDAERAQALQMMFGSDAVRAGNILFKAGAEGVTDMYAAMSNTTAAEVAAEKLDNLSGDMEFLKGSVETLGISIYQDLQGPLRETVGFLTDQSDLLLDAFNTGGLEAVIPMLGTVLGNIVNKIIEFAPQAISAAMSLIESLVTGIVDNMPAIAEAIVVVGATIIKSLLGMIPLIIEGGASLIGGLLSGLGREMPNIIHALMQAAVLMVDAIIQAIPLIVEGGVALLNGLIKGITEALPLLLQQVPILVQSLCDALITAVPALLEGLIQMVTAIVEAMPVIIETLVAAIPQIITSIVTMITTLLPQIIEAGITLFTSLITALPKIITQLVSALPKIIDAVLDGVVSLIPVIIDGGVQLFMGLIGALPEIIGGIVGAIPVIIDSVISALMLCLQQLISAGLALFLALVKALPEIIIGIVAVIPQIINSIITALIDSIPMLIQCGVDLLISLVGNLPTIITSIIAVVPTLITSIINALIKMIPQLIDSGITLFVSLVKALPTIIKSIIAAVPQIVTAIVGAFKSLIWKLVDMGKELLKGLWQGLSDAKQWLIDKVKGLVGSVTDTIKSLFGIHSPSKVFRDEIGKNLMTGLADGIIGGAKYVDKSFVSLKRHIMDQAATNEISAKMSAAVEYSSQDASIGIVGRSSKYVGTDSSAAKGKKASEDPKYIENIIKIDGRDAAKILTPYVVKQMAFNG